jgi:hypothetical protein
MADDIVRQAVQGALVRSIAGQDPVDSAMRVQVASLAHDQSERVRTAMESQEERWEARQVRMEQRGLTSGDATWKEAAERNEMLMDAYMEQLKQLKKISDPR